MICKLVACLSLVLSVQVQEFLVLIKHNLLIFSFMNCAFGVVFETFCSTLDFFLAFLVEVL